APAKYTYFELTGPRRLVMDFHDVQNDLTFKEKQVSLAGVERIRAGQFQDKDRNAARIVFDLDDDARYRVVDDKSALLRVVFAQNRPVAIPFNTIADNKSRHTVLVAQTQMPSSLSAPIVVPVTAIQAPTTPKFSLQSLIAAIPGIAVPPTGSPLALASAA